MRTGAILLLLFALVNTVIDVLNDKGQSFDGNIFGAAINFMPYVMVVLVIYIRTLDIVRDKFLDRTSFLKGSLFRFHAFHAFTAVGSVSCASYYFWGASGWLKLCGLAMIIVHSSYLILMLHQKDKAESSCR